MFRQQNKEIHVENNQGVPMVHSLNKPDRSYFKSLIVGAVIIILGVLTGRLLVSGKTQNSGGVSDSKSGSASQTVVGSKDSKTFRDSAEGDLKAGGINGEGTHKLIRPGGDSQTVALTSSVLDLSKFEGKKVKVWGETFAGQSSGWFMDVGKVELIQ